MTSEYWTGNTVKRLESGFWTDCSSCQVKWLLYSNHLNTRLVWYSNGRFVSICLMAVWNPDWKKPFMVRNVWCSVFRWLLYVKYGCTYLVNLTAMTPYLLRKWRAMSPILPPDTTTLAPESAMALICFSCKKGQNYIWTRKLGSEIYQSKKKSNLVVVCQWLAILKEKQQQKRAQWISACTTLIYFTKSILWKSHVLYCGDLNTGHSNNWPNWIADKSKSNFHMLYQNLKNSASVFTKTPLQRRIKPILKLR